MTIRKEFAPHSTYMGDTLAMTDFTGKTVKYRRAPIDKEYSRTIVAVCNKLPVDMALWLDYPGLLLLMNMVRDHY